MAHNKLYRNFIILQEDKKNKPSSNDKALSGYAKIEAKGEKCKITFYAQNLKEDDDYAIVLICYKKDLKQIIDIGPLTVNNVGKGEACIEYYSDNIAGLSLGYDKISGAGICKKNNGYMDFSMYGFMNGVKPEDNWKKMKVVSSYDKNNVIKQKDTNKKYNDKKTKDIKLDDEKPQYKEDLKDKKLEYKKLEDNKEYEEKTSNKKDNYNVENDDNIKQYCDEEKCNRDDTVDNNDTTDSNITLDDNNIIDVDDVVEVSDTLDNNDLRSEVEEIDNEESDEYNDDLDDEDRGKKKHNHDHCKKHDHCKDVDKCNHHKDIEHHKHGEDCIEHKNKKDYDCDYDVKKYEKHHHDYYCDRDNLVENFEDYERQIEEQRLDPYDFSLRGKIGNFFENLAKGFDEVKEGFKELPYCKWFKVPINDIDDMCNTKDYNKYSIIYYPMLNYYPYIKKYGYFMAGYKCDSKGNLKYLVYAIPGRKDREEQPYGGKSGFVTWCKKEYDDNGFWLMFYDYKNSTIVVPSK